MKKLGTFTLSTSPRRPRADQFLEIRITYTVGEKGLLPAGGIRILSWSPLAPFNLETEGAPGYTTVSCSRKTVRLTAEADISPLMAEAFGNARLTRLSAGRRRPNVGPLITVQVWGGCLKKGDRIRMVFGNRAKRSPGTRLGQHPYKQYGFSFLTWVDYDGSRIYREADSLPISFEPPNAAGLSLFASANASPGKSLNLSVFPRTHREVDDAEDYRGKVEVWQDGSAERKRVDFAEKNKNVTRLRMPIPSCDSSEKIIYFHARDKSRRWEARSNPVLNGKIAGKYNIYWGSLHPHTGISLDTRLGGGNRTRPADSFRHGRDVVNLDFVAVCDHGIGQPDEWQMTLEEWELVRKTAARFYRPGRFVTFSSFEWASERYGDRNMYFLTDDMPMLRGQDIEELYSFYRNTDTIIIPHHVAIMRPVDWDHHDQQLEPLVEICSSHGRCEYFNNPEFKPWREMVPGKDYMSVLDRGYRMGIVAASDDHSARTGTHGMTAVLAEELTREAIFDALRKRRCYGTTNSRMIIDFRVDGHLMGEELRTKTAPQVTLFVAGTTPIKRIEIVHNGSVIHTHSGENLIEEISFRSPSKEPGYYYPRIFQSDGQIGWASPVWVDRR